MPSVLKMVVDKRVLLICAMHLVILDGDDAQSSEPNASGQDPHGQENDDRDISPASGGDKPNSSSGGGKVRDYTVTC